MKLLNTLLAFGITIFGLTQQTEATAEKDFVWYCDSDEATPAQKATVKEIYYNVHLNPEKTACREAFDIILKKSSLSFYFDTVIVSDLAPLTGIDNTEFLTCEGCSQYAVATIPTLPNLSYLSLHGGNLTKAPDLARFPKLRSLSLSQNEISEITVTDSIKKLRSIRLAKTKVANFRFLAEIPDIRSLTIDFPPEGSLRTLPNLPKLNALSASFLTTKDFSFLRKAPNVKSLSLKENGIESLESIFLAESITNLDIPDNKISTISADSLPKRLQRITLSGNPITNYDDLVNLEKIEYLDLSYSDFYDWRLIEILLSKLTHLSLYSTEVSETAIEKSPIKKWPKLEWIGLGETPIKSLAFFKEIEAPMLRSISFPLIEEKNEENCPTSGVPEVVAEFCKQ